MEKINSLIKDMKKTGELQRVSSLQTGGELVPKRPDELPEAALKLEPKGEELSIYQGEPATTEDILSALDNLSMAFPGVTREFRTMLATRIVANQFTKERLKDAISHIIDTCIYPKPSVADIVSFDRKQKTYTYQEILALCAPTYPAFEYYERIQIGNTWRYIEKKR